MFPCPIQPGSIKKKPNSTFSDKFRQKVPFEGTSNGKTDAFNYYYSSIQINIKCAFSMFVDWWIVLQKPMPMNMSIKWTAQLVKVLCILDNFCINNRDNQIKQNIPTDTASIVINLIDFWAS